VDGYLRAYAKDFATGRAVATAMERERRARIVGKSWIAVTISALEVRVGGSEAHARFLQEYRSDKLVETAADAHVGEGRQQLVDRQEQGAE